VLDVMLFDCQCSGSPLLCVELVRTFQNITLVFTLNVVIVINSE